MKNPTIYMTLLIGLAIQATAGPVTPKRGSKERTAVIDPIRNILAKKINQRPIFVVDHLKIDGNWAFFMGKPKTKDGGPIDYRNTEFETDAIEADEITVALLQMKNGKWEVRESGFFTTDVWWEKIWERHPGCPKSILPESAR